MQDFRTLPKAFSLHGLLLYSAYILFCAGIDAYALPLLDEQGNAYLGTAWAHCVNVRLALQHPLQHEVANQPPPAPPIGLVGERNVRPMVARVAKAPMCCEASFGYRVAAEGLVSV